LYNSSVPLGSRGKATTPRIGLVGSVSAGIDSVPVICFPCLSCQYLILKFATNRLDYVIQFDQ
jgi:hypothetical protein